MSVLSGAFQPSTPVADTNGTAGTPAGSPGAPDSQQQSPGSTPVSDPGSPGYDVFKSLFGRVMPAPEAEASDPGKAAQGEGGKEPEKSEQAAPGTSVRPSTEGSEGEAAPPSPAIITLTSEELDRRIQSETDRRFAKRMKEQRAQAQVESDRELRDKNPYLYAQRQREREQQEEEEKQRRQDAEKVVHTYLEGIDRSVMDPLMLALPREQMQKIIQDAQELPDLPGRQHMASEAIKVLQETSYAKGIAEARKKLASDPAFIKEILARHGGVAVEPEPIEAATTTQRPASENALMNDTMRGFWGRGTYQAPTSF